MPRLEIRPRQPGLQRRAGAVPCRFRRIVSSASCTVRCAAASHHHRYWHSTAASWPGTDQTTTALTGRTHGCSDHCCLRKENSCQPGAVHTWPKAEMTPVNPGGGLLGSASMAGGLRRESRSMPSRVSYRSNFFHARREGRCRRLTRSGHRVRLAARANVQFPTAKPTTPGSQRFGKPICPIYCSIT
jgi:hypothetical protein